jgi:G3E family GTPase
MPAPIPAHVVTGPLGSGKTTAIARLLAAKPPAQNWVVLLNEFSAAGIDALTVASAARGAFDVRLIPGGCLCCAGELDFRRTLHELVTVTRPDRIVIEPSGLGHPGGLVDELLGHEAQGRLRLAGIVALVDPRQLRDGGLAPGSEALAQVEVADSLALSKPDLASDDDRARFEALVARLFPAKAWSGALVDGVIPPEAFEPARRAVRGAPPGPRPAAHLVERAAAQRRADAAPAHGHPRLPHEGPASQPGEEGEAAPGGGVPAANGLRSEVRHLGHRALSWVFPRSVEFSQRRLENLLAAALPDASPEAAGRVGAAEFTDAEGTARVARLKGVFRTGEDDWVLAQAGDGFLELRPTSWRRDSRVELLVDGAARLDVTGWDAGWLKCQRR